jgi:hypothetical protein
MMTGGDSSGVKEQAHECGCAVFCVCSLRKRAGLPSVKQQIGLRLTFQTNMFRRRLLAVDHVFRYLW